MNNSNGICFLGVVRLIKRNIIICIIIITLFFATTLLLSKALFSSISVKSSVVVRTTNIDLTHDNYTLLSAEFKATVLGFIKTDAVLESVAKKYDTTTKTLQHDISYSSVGGVVTIIYDGGKSFENGINILNDIVISWQNYIANTEVSDVQGYIDVQSTARENSDLTRTKKLFIVSMSMVGIIAAIVFAALKGIYGKKFEDEFLVASLMKKQPIALYKSKKKEILLENRKNEFDYLILELMKTNSKVVSIISFDGVYTKQIVDNLKTELESYNKSSYIIDLGVSQEKEIEKPINFSVLDKQDYYFEKIEELKNQYDYVFFVSSIKEGPLKNSLICENSDLIILDVQVGMTKKKSLNDFKEITKDRELSYIITK